MDLEPFERLLLRTKAREIATTTNLSQVESTRPLREVLQVLKDKKIQSVPVYDGDNTRSINGFVDVLDITSYALSLFREYERSFLRRTETKFTQSSPSNIFLNTPVGELINYSGRNGLIHIRENADLVDVLTLLNKRRLTARRLALRGEDGRFMGIISQADLAKFVNKNIDIFKLADIKLRELNLVQTCLMVRHDVPMYDTISLLVDTRVSGLALVDWEFNIVANFGCSDLKGFLPDAFDAFWGTTLDFLRQGTSTKSLIPPITCTPETRLREVLSKMASETNPIHRLFVTQNENTTRLEGLCTLTDLISVIGESLSIPPEVKPVHPKETLVVAQGRPISVE